MNSKPKSHRLLAGSALVLSCLISVSLPAVAQDSAKATANWRPKDGIYADPGAGLGERCMDHTELVIELPDKSISGDEWNCKINKFTGAAPDTVKLDATCTNLDEKAVQGDVLVKKDR